MFHYSCSASVVRGNEADVNIPVAMAWKQMLFEEKLMHMWSTCEVRAYNHALINADR